ncbi:MAG: putative TPR repeat methyltransferase [Desulforhopalus sp.]|jgi:predicted TPR repeat methyltransferase
MKQSAEPTPEEFNALFTKACEDHQNQNYPAARKGYVQLLGYFSEAPMLHYNLGLLLFEVKEYGKAVESLLLAAQYNPTDTDILFNLALSYKKVGNLTAAIKMYKEVLQLEPDSVDALYNLGGCYREQKKFDEAIESYLGVTLLDSNHMSASNNLAFVYQVQGETDKAIQCFKKVLELNPDHEAAGHMLAALTGAEVSSSPDAYVKEVFDNYSEHYEKSLVVELEYAVPEKIKHIIMTGDCLKKSFHHGLDLGCGTGLSGEAFYKMTERLDGIDLAPKMVEIAHEKNIYGALYVSGIDEFLKEEVGPFDFVLAADVFGYIGDLKDVFTSVHHRTTEDVLFCFSTETVLGDGYKLRSTGRFAHSDLYIEDLAAQTGWRLLEKHKASLRKEKGAWIEGNLWFMGKEE